MHIVFNSQKEKDNFIKTVMFSCPETMSLKNSETCNSCKDCWNNAIKNISSVRSRSK